MTDIFFSYSSKDRDRVRPIYEALTGLDFDVFWDQQVPAGTDWDTWIKEKLASARSAVVFWSMSSVASDNVRHEATVAKTQGKLVPVMLDDLRVDQFPMGLFTTQAARLMTWTGNGDDAEWRKLVTELQAKAMPAWVTRQLALKDEEVTTERKKREAAQARGDAAHTQLEKEIAGHDDLRRAREQALAEAEKARAELAGVKEAFGSSKAQADDIRAEREKATAEAEKARESIATLKESLSSAEKHNEDMTGRLAAVERMSAAHRSGIPAWGMALGLIGSLALGAGSTYVMQTASATKQESELLKAWQSEREERDKAEADRVAREMRVEAERVASEERAANVEAARVAREVRAEAEREAARAEKEGFLETGGDCQRFGAADQCNRFEQFCRWSYDAAGLHSAGASFTPTYSPFGSSYGRTPSVAEISITRLNLDEP